MVLLDAFDGVLPAKPEICCRTPEDTRQYEEDRRLFYVAMTRARHKLVLFDCKTMPSVFVQEVIFNLPESRAERELAKAETNRVLGRNKPAAAGPALPPVDVAAVTRVGAAVQMSCTSSASLLYMRRKLSLSRPPAVPVLRLPTFLLLSLRTRRTAS